jgi:predicted amidohydrolase
MAAAVQFEPRFGEKEHNIGRLVELTTEAAQAGARLVVLPEMATTGYCFLNRREIAPMVEQVPDGPTVRTFAALAARLGIHVVVGLPELEPSTGAYYNTAALIGPHGYIGEYRKTHSYIDETRWARDGDLGIPVFETDLGRIAIQICMDGDYFEPSRVAALAGADVIAFPTNWLGRTLSWRARAVENGVYLIAADRWGQERGSKFAGDSVILNPRGEALNLLSTGDGLVLAEIDLDQARTARAAALALRRPDQYQELLLSSYLWAADDAQTLPAGRPAVVAVGPACDGAHMADLARWADKQVRDRGWAKLDLAVFPYAAAAPDGAGLLAVALDLDCHLVWAARDPDGCNTAYLLGPEGLVGRYRQVHAEDGAVPGDEGFPVFDLPWGRIGLLVGQDLAVPESARILAKLGADLILVPGMTGGDRDRWLWSVRAMENNTALAVANAEGISVTVGPGKVAGGDPGAMTVTLVDTAAPAIRTKELLRKLQPRWYDALVSR